jgi:hypothetical protein
MFSVLFSIPSRFLVILEETDYAVPIFKVLKKIEGGAYGIG